MANKKICVFDFETDGKNPHECSPVQLACVMIDPIKLEIIKDSEFNINLRPELLEKNIDHQYDNDILDFHAKVKGCSQSDILELWKTYPKQEQSWKQFTNYLDKYHCRSTKKNEFSAPIAAGYNIHRFDLVIVNRLSQKYKNTNKENYSNIFYPRDVLDIMNLIFYWFENIDKIKSYSLDNIRDYLGIDKSGAHDALKDVKDCANILIRFLKLHRNLSPKVNFENSFK
jgi:DNA polymerase III epsilon subunit-like protein